METVPKKNTVNINDEITEHDDYEMNKSSGK